MNLKRAVWLPPDGDARLVRFQQDVAACLGGPGLGIPPHLELLPASRVPEGPVHLGSWVWHEGEPVLEASDSRGPLGVFRFGLGVLPDGAPPLERLPPPPSWSWTRGMTALLEVDEHEPTFIRWSWEAKRGWKAAPTP